MKQKNITNTKKGNAVSNLGRGGDPNQKNVPFQGFAAQQLREFQNSSEAQSVKAKMPNKK